MCCSICQDEFDCSVNIPIVGKCGHSVCEPCLVSPDVPRNRLNRPMLECPLCRTRFAFEKMARNFQMIEVMESLSREVEELRDQLEEYSTTDSSGEYLSESEFSEESGDDDNSSVQTDDSETDVMTACVVNDAEAVKRGGVRRSVFLQNTSTLEYVHYDIPMHRSVGLPRALTCSTISPGQDKLISIIHYPQANNCSIEVDYWVDQKHKRRKNAEYDRVLVIDFPPT